MELIPFFFLFVFLFFIFNDQYSIWQDFRTGPYFIMHTAFVKKAQLKQEAQWFISFQETKVIASLIVPAHLTMIHL